MQRSFVAMLIGFLSLSGCTPGNLSSGGSETMVNHFAGTCRSSIGSWTTSALQQTQSLVATLETIKAQQNEDCAGLTTALAATQEIHRRLQLMTQDPAINSYREAEERKLEVLLALARTSSKTEPELILQLREELYATELEIVRTRADASISRQDNDRLQLINGLSDMNQYVLSLLSQGNLSACLAASPQMPLGIAASLLAIGGNFATPLVGAGMSAIGNLMSTTVHQLRSMPLDQAQIDLENPRMQAAMTCSLESMMHLYCDAEDSYQFVEYALSSYRSRGQVSDLWKGMDLLGRRMPVLNRWLLKVASGVDPADRYAAARLNDVWKRRSRLREIQNLVLGELNQTKRLLSGISDPNEMDLRAKSGFKKIVQHMYGSMGGYPPESGDSNPFVAFLSQTNAICRLSATQGCAAPSFATDVVSEMIDTYGITGGFSAFESRVKVLLDDVYKLIGKELLDTINQDPDILVAEAIQPSLGNWSALRVLRELAAFSKRYAETLREIPAAEMPGRGRAIAVVEDSEQAFTAVADEIEGGRASVEVINTVFERLKLLDGLQFANQRIMQMVSWELEHRLKSGELPDELKDDLVGAGLSLVEQLERSGINIQNDAEAIIGDLRNAQYIARENLRLTSEIFGPTIGQFLASMRQSALSAGESDPNDPATRRLAQLCLMVLTTSATWPTGADIQLCKGTNLVSIFGESGPRLSFDAIHAAMTKPGEPMAYKQRVCAYSNFLRASRLFQIDSRRHSFMLTDDSGRVPISPFDFIRQIFPFGRAAKEW